MAKPASVHVNPVTVFVATGFSGSQLRAIFPSRQHLAMSGDIFGCHNWQGFGEVCLRYLEAKDAANYLIQEPPTLRP